MCMVFAFYSPILTSPAAIRLNVFLPEIRCGVKKEERVFSF